MGYTSTALQHKETPRQHILRKYANNGWDVLDESMSGGAHYALLFDPKTGEYLLAVMLHSVRDGEITTKGLSEDDGPLHYDCPARMLDKLEKLHEPRTQYAKEWRKECREHATKKKAIAAMKPGATVTFPKPIEFTTFKEADFRYQGKFLVNGYKTKQPIYQAVGSGKLVKLKKDELYQAQIVNP